MGCKNKMHISNLDLIRLKHSMINIKYGPLIKLNSLNRLTCNVIQQ